MSSTPDQGRRARHPRELNSHASHPAAHHEPVPPTSAHLCPAASSSPHACPITFHYLRQTAVCLAGRYRQMQNLRQTAACPDGRLESTRPIGKPAAFCGMLARPLLRITLSYRKRAGREVRPRLAGDHVSVSPGNERHHGDTPRAYLRHFGACLPDRYYQTQYLRQTAVCLGDSSLAL